MKKTRAAAVVFLGGAPPTWAGLDDGLAAFNIGDYATAFIEFQTLAERGNTIAQYYLGVMYDYGRGVPENDVEAARWFRVAAEQGFLAAQNDLGLMYVLGHGVPQDDDQALHWWQKAADKGFPAAQKNLGLMHRTGRGVPKDLVQALMWYKLAADGGNKEAANNRDKFVKNMTPEQIAEARRRARTWAARHGRR